MKFLVNNVRADLVITPEKNQTSAPPAEVTETQVNSEMELLRSHDILEQVVLDNKLYERYQSDDSHPPSRKSIEKASTRLLKVLDISALRKSDVIDVTYRDSNADLTLNVLRDLGNRYLTSHLEAHSAPGTDQFFAQQVQKFDTQLTQARTAIAAFHQEKGLFSMPDQQSALVERFEAASSQLKDVNAQIQSQEARLGAGERELAATPDRVVTQVKQTANQLALQQLEPLLAQLENRRIELTTKYEPSERFVVEVDEQIANTKKEIARIRADRMDEQTTDLNTLHQAINSDYTRGQIDLTGLKAQRVELAGMRQQYLHELAELDQAYIQLQSLEHYEKEAQDNLLLYTHRLDEARLAEALDRDKFSNVVMVEKPVASPIPVFPKIGINLAVGAAMGIFFFLAVAFHRETRENLTSTEGNARDIMQAGAFQPASGD